jgi:hypothetical protein
VRGGPGARVKFLRPITAGRPSSGQAGDRPPVEKEAEVEYNGEVQGSTKDGEQTSAVI